MPRQRRSGYRPATDGSAAYDLSYYGNAVAVPAPEYTPGYAPDEAPLRRRSMPEPEARPQAAPKVRTRTRVRVREQQRVAPFALCGFAAALAIAVVLLLGYVRLNEVYAESVTLQNQLTALESEGAQLEARYEEVFDMRTLEQAAEADGTLSHPTPGQSYYIDLSEADNAVVYQSEDGQQGAQGFFGTLKSMLEKAVEYFR